jgi:hypothetical protein
MAATLELIAKTWGALQPALREEKCSSCECLQGALVELKLVLEELPVGGEQEALLTAVDGAMRVREPHACLGCEPCNPGNILADFYRAQQAAEAAQPCSDAG